MRAISGMFRSHVLRFAVLLASINVDAAEGTPQSGDQPVAVSASLSFSRDVFPILQRSCLECHGSKKQEGQLRLDGRQNLVEADVVDPQHPDASELIRRISLPRNHDEIMPATGDPLTANQVSILRQWIARGAEWPDSFEIPKHWSYQIPVKSEPPQEIQSNWSRSPIDAFGGDKTGTGPVLTLSNFINCLPLGFALRSEAIRLQEPARLSFDS